MNMRMLLLGGGDGEGDSDDNVNIFLLPGGEDGDIGGDGDCNE